MSKLSEQLFELMTEDGFTQISLATAMNTPRTKLSMYLNDKSLPEYKYLVAIVEFFHCSADFLIGLSDDPKREIKYKPVAPFDSRLRELIKIKKTSQYALIKQTGISWNTLHHWLIAKSFPSVENLIKLKKFFDCSIDYILGRES